MLLLINMGFDNYSVYLTSVDKCLNDVKNQRYTRFKRIYDLLFYQKELVNTIFSLIMHNKSVLFPLGLEYDGIVNAIKLSYNFGDNNIKKNEQDVTEDVRCILNSMSVLGLLELRPANKSYDITPFGMEYWIETTTKLKNNKLLD